MNTFFVKASIRDDARDYSCIEFLTFWRQSFFVRAPRFHFHSLRWPLTHLCPPLRSTFAVRETASLGIMGAPRVPPLNPSETIVLSAQSGERDQSVCMYVYIYLYIYICILHIYTQGVPKDTNTFQSIII